MGEIEPKSFQKRSPAVPVAVGDILAGTFAREHADAPLLLMTPWGQKIARVNIIALLVDKIMQGQNSHGLIDDGTGRLIVRSFDTQSLFERVQVGDMLLVIGRPREFNNEPYIAVEILKNIDNPRWMEVRRHELARRNTPVSAQKKELLEKNEDIAPQKIIENTEEIIADTPPEKEPDVLMYIREMDAGSGVPIHELEKKMPAIDVLSELDYLLKRGDVFEVRPGVVKVLE